MFTSDTNIILAKQNDKAELALLWKEVFNDSDEFIKLFFDNVYKPENTLVAKRNSQIVSTLHTVPYKIKINDLMLDAAYICGVCTRESERGKGFMNLLMNGAMEFIKERGFAFSFLIPATPWLFDVYRDAGYKFEIRDARCRTQDADRAYRRISPDINIIPCNLNHYPYFNKKQLERQCCILHDYKDFDIILQDNRIDDGQVFVALHNHAPAGMVFAKQDDHKTVMIAEILYDSEIIGETLAYHAGKYFNATKIKYLFPHGLGCILDKNIPDTSNLYMTLMLD
jgi:predicted acetyltransferase